MYAILSIMAVFILSSFQRIHSHYHVQRIHSRYHFQRIHSHYHFFNAFQRLSTPSQTCFSWPSQTLYLLHNKRQIKVSRELEIDFISFRMLHGSWNSTSYHMILAIDPSSANLIVFGSYRIHQGHVWPTLRGMWPPSANLVSTWTSIDSDPPSANLVSCACACAYSHLYCSYSHSHAHSHSHTHTHYPDVTVCIVYVMNETSSTSINVD